MARSPSMQSQLRRLKTDRGWLAKGYRELQDRLWAPIKETARRSAWRWSSLSYGLMCDIRTVKRSGLTVEMWLNQDGELVTLKQHAPRL